jgi:prepilin-type N-terminal cleavage/methylation domain-containing protein
MLHRTSRRRPHRRGFTIPEVLMALAITGFAVSIFGASFPACGRALSRSRHTDIASDACQQQLELYRQVGYDSLPAIPAGSSSLKVQFAAPAGLPGATGAVTFTRLDSSFSATTQDTGRVRADAGVAWTGTGSDRGAITVTSLIAQVPQ